jgi:hypothetical protein
MTMMDDMRVLLERRLEEEGMPPGIPISVAELHRRLLPYPLCRDRLGFATKAEYDVGLLRLFVDGESLEVPEAALVEAASSELRSPEPGLAMLQRFAASEVMLRRAGASSAATAPPMAEPEKTAGAAGPEPRNGAGGQPVESEAPAETGPPLAELETGRERTDFIPGLDDPMLVPQDESADALGRSRPAAGSGAPCRSCRAPLPDRAGLRYCPRCGADQELWPCPSCGEEVERGWRYCALCGKMIAQ